MVIFYPCSIPCFLAITGRIARKKNKHQRTRLLRIIQAILFHTDIWYNAPFQFSDHFLCLFVTRPSLRQSCMLFPCTQKAGQGLEGCFLHCGLKTALYLWPNLLVYGHVWPWLRSCRVPPKEQDKMAFLFFFTAGTLTVINVIVLLQLSLPVRILSTCIDVVCLWRKQISVIMTRSVGNASHGLVPHSGACIFFIAWIT